MSGCDPVNAVPPPLQREPISLLLEKGEESTDWLSSSSYHHSHALVTIPVISFYTALHPTQGFKTRVVPPTMCRRVFPCGRVGLDMRAPRLISSSEVAKRDRASPAEWEKTDVSLPLFWTRRVLRLHGTVVQLRPKAAAGTGSHNQNVRR